MGSLLMVSVDPGATAPTADDGRVGTKVAAMRARTQALCVRKPQATLLAKRVFAASIDFPCPHPPVPASLCGL